MSGLARPGISYFAGRTLKPRMPFSSVRTARGHAGPRVPTQELRIRQSAFLDIVPAGRDRHHQMQKALVTAKKLAALNRSRHSPRSTGIMLQPSASASSHAGLKNPAIPMQSSRTATESDVTRIKNSPATCNTAATTNKPRPAISKTSAAKSKKMAANSKTSSAGYASAPAALQPALLPLQPSLLPTCHRCWLRNFPIWFSIPLCDRPLPSPRPIVASHCSAPL